MKSKNKEITDKIWHIEDPPKLGSYICRMSDSYIKMCYWDGNEWFDMWQLIIEGIVFKWMYIPYD